MSPPLSLSSPSLTTLRHSLQQLAALEIGLQTFERRCPPACISEWQALLTSVSRESVAYADLCCALAYYRAGTDGAFAYLLEAEYRPDPRVPLHTQDTWTVVSHHLAILYRKRGDMRFMEWLLDLRSPTARSRRAHLDALATLVAEHTQSLLVACYGFPHRAATLARALSHQCHKINEDTVWKAYLRLLERTVQTRDMRQMWSARRVQSSLTQEWRRWGCQQLL